MDNLYCAQQTATPFVASDWAAGTLTMRGDCYPEHAYALFHPILEGIKRFLAQGTRPLNLQLELSYLNTSSVMALMDLFDLLEAAHRDGRAVAVHWHYDSRNERLAELAEEFREDFSFPFSIEVRGAAA